MPSSGSLFEAGDLAPADRACEQILELLTRETGYADDITMLAAQRVVAVEPLEISTRAELTAMQEVRHALTAWLEPLAVRPLDEMALQHARMLGVQECGPDARPDSPLPGSARGQLVHYLKGMPGAAQAREGLVRINTLGDVLTVLERLRESCENGRRMPREAWALTAV